MKTIVKLLLICLSILISYISWNIYLFPLWAALILGIIMIILVFWISSYFSSEAIRARVVRKASQQFRNYCKNIVEYQYNPKNEFEEKDLKEALRIKLPKPVENSHFDKIFTFTLFEDFEIKITLHGHWWNTGGSATYQEFSFAGHSFASCTLLEKEKECASFSYKERYINWITKEFQETNNTKNEFEFLENSEKIRHQVEVAKIKKMSDEIKHGLKSRRIFSDEVDL